MRARPSSPIARRRTGSPGEDLEALGERVRVVRADEEAGLALVDDVWHAADLRGDDGPSCGQSLDDRHRRALARGRQHDGVADGVPRGDVLLVAEEEAGAREAEVVRALLEALAVVTVADEEQQRVDAALAHAGEHRQKIVGPLHRRHPAEPADDELPFRDAVAAPDLDRVAVEADTRLELDPEADDGEPLARRDVERNQLVPHLGADGDQPVRGAGEERLDGAEDERPAGAEVAAEHVTVERVHDHRATRPASSAAVRPTAPALAVCVWTTSGRSLRIRRASLNAASASRTGDSSRDRPGSVTISTPACSATNDIDASPRATSPATRVVV